MYILGLTGSIGMGKSTAAKILRRAGLPVHDADTAVHRLMAKGGAAVGAIEAAFPGVVFDGVIDRQLLGRGVFQDPAALRRLEAILHPLVRQVALDFLKRQSRARAPLVVLDIPLLYETGGESLCDAVVVVSAPYHLQIARVMRRPNMTAAKLAGIMAQQMSDADKCILADYVVHTGLGKRESLRELLTIVRLVRSRRGRRWPIWRSPVHSGRRLERR